MSFFNLMSGEGWSAHGGFSSGMIMGWVGLLILIILWMVGKKFLEDYDFNPQYSIAGGILYLILISFTGSAKWSLLAGLAVFFAGGFGINYFTGGGE